MMNTEERINEMFDRLVPASGKADTVAGEIVRAMCRIGYRWQNDGDAIGVGYGRHTCNAAARFLLRKCSESVVIAKVIGRMWGMRDEEWYEELLDELESEVVEFLEERPELEGIENSDDMFDFYDPETDDDCWDDEDEEDEEDW